MVSKKNDANAFILWMSGLSGSGKTTLANALVERWKGRIPLEHLDGDALREVLGNQGFSEAARNQNVKTAGFMAARLQAHGVNVIGSLISPYREARTFIRETSQNFFLLYLSTPLVTCQKRDPKGLYEKVEKGEIQHFTGIDDPFEVPQHPDLVIDTSTKNLEETVLEVEGFLRSQGFDLGESS